MFIIQKKNITLRVTFLIGTFVFSVNCLEDNSTIKVDVVPVSENTNLFNETTTITNQLIDSTTLNEPISLPIINDTNNNLTVIEDFVNETLKDENKNEINISQLNNETKIDLNQTLNNQQLENGNNNDNFNNNTLNITETVDLLHPTMLFTNNEKINVSNEAVADVPEKLPVRLSYQEMNNPQQSPPQLSPSIGGQQSAASPSIINNSPPNLLPTQIFEVCTSNDCNGHGSCLGFRSAPFCSCNSGYLGFKCEDTACDNNLHCSGRGSCIGSVNQHFCFCNIGYSGNSCQNQLR
uniref:EGF-like domain-containing protein n=1 Tax=Meloidogyne enterolobii TaxID=390850 RepID=A0A6V7U5A1_MELEN|nr:unnamed protein product [Meloidogyne enterolobii]